MKRWMIVIALILFVVPVVVTAQTQQRNLVKNGEFENFSGDTPVSWETSNIPGTLTVVSSTPLGYRGTRAVKCEVKEFYGTKIAGFICQKDILLTGRDLQLSLRYLFHSVGKDAAVVIVCFLNAAGSTIGTVDEYFREDKSEFEPFVKDITAPDAASRCHVRLTILSDPESDTLHPGSYAVFDDVKLVVLPPKAQPAVQPVDTSKVQ